MRVTCLATTYLLPAALLLHAFDLICYTKPPPPPPLCFVRSALSLARYNRWLLLELNFHANLKVPILFSSSFFSVENHRVLIILSKGLFHTGEY